MKESQLNKKYYSLFLSVFSAFLLVLSYFLGGFLNFFSLVPLLLIKKHFLEKNTWKSFFKLWSYLYLSFLIWNISLVYWLTYINFAGGVTVIILNPLLMTIPFLFSRLTAQILGNFFLEISFIIFYLSFEYLHLNWMFSFPWLHFGNSFALLPSWVQWYEYIGILGGSLWILLTNILIFKGLFSKKYFFVIAFLWIIIPLGISLIQFYQYEEKGKEVEIVVIQPDFDVYKEKLFSSENFVPFEQQIARVHQLLEKQITPNTDLILMPEATLDHFFEISRVEKGLERHIQNLTSILEKYPHTSILAGITTFQFCHKDSIPPKSARYNPDIDVHYVVYNSAAFFEKNKTPELYHKSKLVIGGEFVPFVEWVGDWSIVVGGTSGMVTPQKEREVFKNQKGNYFAPIICYESVFGNYVSEYTEKNAEILCVITNDGYWDRSLELNQHFQLDRLRCIEQRKSMARAAYTGISGFINQKGEIIVQSPAEIPIALKGTIKANNQKTFYQQNGDGIGKIAVLGTFILLVLIVFRTFLKKNMFLFSANKFFT